MYQQRDDLNDRLKYKVREQKRVLNNVSLVLIVWLMLILLAMFLSRTVPEIQNSISLFGCLSIIPVVLLEIKIILKLAQVRKERSALEVTKDSLNYDEE